LKLWTLDHRRVRANLIELFKMVRGLSTVDVNTFFEFDNTGRTRGHYLKLKRVRVSTDLRQHFFTERVFYTWNQLESSVVESESLNILKSKLQRLHDKDESFFGQHPIDFGGRASSPGEASSGKLSGKLNDFAIMW